jgi:hypothetical protein
MKLTGKQIKEIADISDGADVELSEWKNGMSVRVQRLEDNFLVRVYPDGKTVTFAKQQEKS